MWIRERPFFSPKYKEKVMKYIRENRFNNKGTAVIKIASKDRLLDKPYYELIWAVITQMKADLNLSRRQLGNAMMDIVSEAYSLCELMILGEDSMMHHIPEYDDIFPDDLDCTWFGRYMEANKNNPSKPLRYSYMHEKYLIRLQHLDIIAKIYSPECFRNLDEIC